MGGKFGVENAVSNLEFGVWKIWGGKCYLESRIWGVENLGWKMLSRISNLGFGKFGVENAISKLQFEGVENLGGKCYLESRIWGVENLGWKMLSRIWGVDNLGRKMLSRISNLGGGKFGVENANSKFIIWGGGIFGAENAISNLQFGWVENLG